MTEPKKTLPEVWYHGPNGWVLYFANKKDAWGRCSALSDYVLNADEVGGDGACVFLLAHKGLYQKLHNKKLPIHEVESIIRNFKPRCTA